MPAPELDWRLEDIPGEDEAPGASPAPDGLRPRRAWRWSWRRAALALGLLALAALALFAYQQVGWRRLRAQVAQEVAFEDERSAAGDQMAVLAMQAVDNARWRSQRSQEAAHGLAAPLPAPHLSPAGTPPQLLRLDTAGGDVFTATVRRAYTDLAGQTYAFDLTQRYRNVSAGLWQRLPPLPPVAAEGWTGQYLSAASLPLGEEALWAADLLPVVDQRVAEACAAWDCPANLVLRVEIDGDPDAAPAAGLPTWAAAEGGLGQAAPYPTAFDVVTALPFIPPGGPLTLPALSITGVPADAPARQALTHALTLRALFALAARLSAVTGPGSDPFLVALVARAEARLGLSAGSAALPPAESLLSPAFLWRGRNLSSNAPSDSRPASLSSLAGRQHGLAFLNHVLRGQPATADGVLLNSLFRQRALTDWLAGALGREAAEAALPAWAEALTAEYARQSGQPAPDPTGLYYFCGDGLYQVGAAGPRRLVSDASPVEVFTSLAVGERYLAYLSSDQGREMSVTLVEPAVPSARLVATGQSLSLLGWSAAGQLLYLLAEADDVGSTLMRYDPATDQHEALLERVTAANLSLGASWTADRTTVGLTLLHGTTGTEPAAVRVVDPVEVEPLADSGSGAWLSPDGQYAAYAEGEAGTAAYEVITPTVRVVVRSAPGFAPRTVVAEATFPGSSAEAGGIGLVNWAADSRALVFAAITAEGEFSAYRLALAGGPPELLAAGIPGEFGPLPVGFSADGQSLVLAYSGDGGATRLTVLAWPDGPTREYAPLGGLVSLAWSATGHLLALPTMGGLYLTDPATGAARWVTMEGCVGAGWHP